jgi:solute carrier family 12 sodium/potassium/chloride transporter 2
MKNIMLLIMLISLSNFLAGSIMGPSDELEQAQGFIGYSSKYLEIKINYAIVLNFYKCITVELLKENWNSNYFVTDGQMQNFISVFSVYFPACIGILAGANVSGDLKVKRFLSHFIK